MADAELALKRVGQAVCIGVPLQWGLGNEAIILTGTWITGKITQCWRFLDHIAWCLVFHSPRNFLANDSLWMQGEMIKMEILTHFLFSWELRYFCHFHSWDSQYSLSLLINLEKHLCWLEFYFMKEKTMSHGHTWELCYDEDSWFRENSPCQLKNKWDVSKAVSKFLAISSIWPVSPPPYLCSDNSLSLP